MFTDQPYRRIRHGISFGGSAGRIGDHTAVLRKKTGTEYPGEDSMKLKEVIRIDEKFQHSINLKLDQMRKEPIENYIPTQASMKILCEYLEDLPGKIHE